MRLTKKLLGFLHRVFDKDPAQFLALRLGYSGSMAWKVRDAVLTTTVTGGPGANLVVDLSAFSVRTLIAYLAAQPGYTVLYADDSEMLSLSARVLLDGGADIASSNGDHLYGYTNVLFAYAEAAANELQQAEAQIQQMLLQMSTKTASLEWLDELGGYYGIPRLVGEADGSYAPRIIAEVLRPRANNVAIEMAIREFTGQPAKVTDVVLWTGALPIYNGQITHNSTALYNVANSPVYGLFDVEYGYDLLNGGSISGFASVVRDLIGRLRAAGTQLRALSLSGSVLADDVPAAPTDGDAGLPLTITSALTDAGTAPVDGAMAMSGQMTTLTDTVAAPSDDGSLLIDFKHQYNGLRTYSGSFYHQGGLTVNDWTTIDFAAQVAALFASLTVPKLWLDPSNAASRYQNFGSGSGLGFRGSMKASAVGDPVGLLLDCSQALARGPETVTDTGLTSAASWAVTGANSTHKATFSAGGLRYESDTTSPQLTVQQNTSTGGKFVELTVTCSAWTSGSVKIFEQTGFALEVAGVGTTTAILKNATGSIAITRASANVDLTLSFIGVRELPGNHVGQALAASRPLYQEYNGMPYLFADGIDDSLYSLANLDLSGADKVTVIMGVRKRSAADVGMLAELGPNFTLGGAFGMYYVAANPDSSFLFGASGSSAYPTRSTASPTPDLAVLVGVADLAAANNAVTLQRNGTTVTGTGAPGARNLISGILNLLRRNNDSLPAAADFFGLMVIGRLLTPEETSTCVRYMASKNGAVLL